ncbi:MAG: ACP S-malonyltransferase, partial [Verrucomicrobiota bacterium]
RSLLVYEVDAALGFSLSSVMADGPIDELTRTSRCQPALFVHGLLCWELLQKEVTVEPVAAAGLSLGEFTAHAAAGTFSYIDGLELVSQRGTFMEEATEQTEGAMAAMIGGTEEAVDELARECGVDVANYNAPGQIVLSGSKEGIERAVDQAKAKGIKMAKPLTVAGAYHSRLMASAQEKLESVLQSQTMSAPSIPVICNVNAAEVKTEEEIKSSLTRQVTGSVRWSESMAQLAENGCDTFLELGPGGVLAGLMRRIAKGVTVHSIHDSATLEKAVVALQG